MEKKRYAVVPVEAFREMFWSEAVALINELTLAGTDTEKVTAALNKLIQHNLVRAQVEYIEK